MDQFLQFAGNHLLLFAAFGTVLLLLIANEVHGNLSGGLRLPPGEAVRQINDRNALLVDVRSPADFKRGHIIGAVNVPLAKLAERSKELGKAGERPLIVYCALGSTAPQAAEQLRKQGYAEVAALKGGLNAWQSAGLPVTTK